MKLLLMICSLLLSHALGAYYYVDLSQEKVITSVDQLPAFFKPERLKLKKSGRIDWKETFNVQLFDLSGIKARALGLRSFTVNKSGIMISGGADLNKPVALHCTEQTKITVPNGAVVIFHNVLLNEFDFDNFDFQGPDCTLVFDNVTLLLKDRSASPSPQCKELAQSLATNQSVGEAFKNPTMIIPPLALVFANIVHCEGHCNNVIHGVKFGTMYFLPSTTFDLHSGFLNLWGEIFLFGQGVLPHGITNPYNQEILRYEALLADMRNGWRAVN